MIWGVVQLYEGLKHQKVSEKKYTLNPLPYLGNFSRYQLMQATEIKMPEESGQSKGKKVLKKLADTLNGCLCGLVVH